MWAPESGNIFTAERRPNLPGDETFKSEGQDQSPVR